MKLENIALENENLCPFCNSGFSTKYELNRHPVSVHEVENLQEFEDFQQKSLLVLQ